MYVVLGASGHVGSAVAKALITAGKAVTVMLRRPETAARWRERGADVAICDVTDVDTLREVFARGKRAFLLNPPAPPSTDTDVEEHRTFSGIVAALEGSGLEKVVVESTYGAQAGDRLGDLSVLYDFEQALASQPIPVTVLRAAYYMSNWDMFLDAAKAGTLPTMLPADLKLPMVAPADIGVVAARLLYEPTDTGRLVHIEGPVHYSSRDAAAAFAHALGRNVILDITPREKREDAYGKLGFSKPAAEAYARMTTVSVDGGFETPLSPERGATTLEAYIGDLVRRSPC